ncbi:response regulator transcription factor [Bacillaceae bacterium IKA-2]|nr:response regulator transcription factor [Bacillaceae bacterium IKA-2]
MKVLVGIKHELLRYGLVELLKDVQPIEYMVMVSDVKELNQALRNYHFDLIIVDERLQGDGGLRSVLAVLKTVQASSKRVLMFNEAVQKLEVMTKQEVFQGLFYEHSTLEELMDFFHRVLKGEHVYLNTDQKSGLFSTLEETEHDLSKREEEVFYMKVRGYTLKDTAEALKISPRTAENHRLNIRKKLNIEKNSDWYKWGKQLGVL